MRSMSTALVAGFHVAGPTRLALAEIRGHDELAIDGIDTRAAIGLLDRLIDPSIGSAMALCASDRDSLFVALHQSLWGDQINATLDCSACGEKFDLSFPLSSLQAHLWAQRPSEDTPSVPLGKDELAAAEKGVVQGVEQLSAQLGIGFDQLDVACETLQKHFPLLDVEFDTACAECGHLQQASFDIQSFLLLRLIGERPRLYVEIDALAAVYGWSLQEILSLTRSTRRALTARVEASRTGANRSLA